MIFIILWFVYKVIKFLRNYVEMLQIINNLTNYLIYYGNDYKIVIRLKIIPVHLQIICKCIWFIALNSFYGDHFIFFLINVLAVT